MLNQNIDFYIKFKGPSPFLTLPRKMDIVKAFIVSGCVQHHVYKKNYKDYHYRIVHKHQFRKFMNRLQLTV